LSVANVGKNEHTRSGQKNQNRGQKGIYRRKNQRFTYFLSAELCYGEKILGGRRIKTIFAPQNFTKHNEE